MSTENEVVEIVAEEEEEDEEGEEIEEEEEEYENAKPEDPDEKRVGCAHYKRRAKFVTPCCNKMYMCRYCHDENEQHYFNRKTKVQAECIKCGVRFGKYTCLICNLFDDEDKKQYHCDGCGICRVGGRDRFFHCKRCNMCLPEQLQRVGHRCVENVSRSNCPVCLEDIHTSRIPCHIPDCGHLLHRPCFQQLLHSGHYACPTCQTSMIDMTTLWSYLDSEVAATPMPPEYADYKATILCKDCHKLSTVKFHVVGLKCEHCGAYNTCQTNGFQNDEEIEWESQGAEGGEAPTLPHQHRAHLPTRPAAAAPPPEPYSQPSPPPRANQSPPSPSRPIRSRRASSRAPIRWTSRRKPDNATSGAGMR
ncbi:unnamed protein product [Plutella xylostella]|uniref:(diamondback moth) hypothetical protein n=1 Tax=Plutella xylostella TaxID=51655 RepID=A0A8S4G9L7_PLUXY|nr:unnamed protein product [Plutella xylostella]